MDFKIEQKYPKEAFNEENLGFTHIARFSSSNSFLHQALMVGLIEIIIRFKDHPKYTQKLT